MRIAIPTFGPDISPRFCFAQDVLVIDVVEGAQSNPQRVQLGQSSWTERIAILSARKVDVLLCNGFPKACLPVAEDSGIRVVAGLTGTIEAVLDSYLRGEIQVPAASSSVDQASDESIDGCEGAEEEGR